MPSIQYYNSIVGTQVKVSGENVGIGTDTPSSAGGGTSLHIHDTNYPEVKLTNDNTGSTSDDGSVIQVVNSEFRFTNREDGNSISFYAFDSLGTSRQKLILSESSIVVNGAQTNTDFRVAGDADPNVLVVDANNDCVSIGANSNLDYVKLLVNNSAQAGSKAYHQIWGGTNYGTIGLINASVNSTLSTVNGLYSYMHTTTNGAVSSMYHFRADPPSGAGTISNQAGFYAGAGLTYATNNYGFYGYVPEDTNNWNLYMGSSAKNYINGNLGIGTATPQAKLDVVYPQSGCVRFTDSAGSGIMIGDCALSSNADYAGIQHTKMVGSYMMVSDGDDTYISARDTQSVFIRGGGNDPNSEISIHDVGIGGVGIVFNEQGADRDIRMEGAGDTNLFRLDASTDSIGIGTDTPAEKLHVNGNVLVANSFYTSPTGTIVGTSGWIYQSGQVVNSQGSFGVYKGDAQNSIYLLRETTTDNSWTTLLNNGQSGVLLASNRTFQFSVNIVARRTNGQDNAAYKLEGFLYNDGYGCSIVGNPIKTVFGESDTGWDVRAQIATSADSNYLFIQTLGSSSKTINWLAKVDMLEVGGNIDGYTEANILGFSSNLIP